MRVLVTGGAGFIGSAVCRLLAANVQNHVVNLDKLTYAGNLKSLGTVSNQPNYRFVQGDIADEKLVGTLLVQERIDVIMHLAAESHVDRSIDGPSAFIETNIVGTFRLLNAALDYWRNLNADAQTAFRFHHVSTDEVFGDLPFDGGVFTESSAYAPSSPYSASKAAADHLVRAWHETYDLPIVMSNCSNNYGPFHFPEKLIPLVLLNALDEQPLPVYGRGDNVRDWLYVEDHARALETVATRGKIGENYNIGGRAERRNIDVVNAICAILDKKQPRSNGLAYADLIEMVSDRRGHDRRYAIDPGKIETELDWHARESFDSGLEKTVSWYLANEWWWRPLREKSYAGERLGRGGGNVS